MDRLVFLELARVRLEIQDSRGRRPLTLPGVVFSIRLFARRKNDYLLDPFISDASGVVSITREACELLVPREHDSGLMDYAGLEFCQPEVEIRHRSGEEIRCAARSRRTAWRLLLGGEDPLFGSIEDLVAVYERAPNGCLGIAQPLRVRWDGSELRPECVYVVGSMRPSNRGLERPGLLPHGPGGG